MRQSQADSKLREIRDWAATIIRDNRLDTRDAKAVGNAVARAIRGRIHYAGDPLTNERLETTRAILSRGSADCDGLCVVQGALLTAMGVPWRATLWRPDAGHWRHVFVQIQAPGGRWLDSDPVARSTAEAGLLKNGERASLAPSGFETNTIEIEYVRGERPQAVRCVQCSIGGFCAADGKGEDYHRVRGMLESGLRSVPGYRQVARKAGHGDPLVVAGWAAQRGIAAAAPAVQTVRGWWQRPDVRRGIGWTGAVAGAAMMIGGIKILWEGANVR